MEYQNLEPFRHSNLINLQMAWSGLPKKDETGNASEILENFWNLPQNLLAIANKDNHMFEELSPAWEKALGYSIAELKSRPWDSFVHPEDLPLTLMEGEKLKSGLNTIGFENRYQKKDGEYAWLSWIATPIGDKLYCRVTDVTEKVLAQKRSEESEKRFRLYAEAMPQMAFIADPDGNMIYFNKRHYHYLGIEPQEDEGWKWRDQNIIHPDDLVRTVDVWTHSLDTGEPYDIEYRLRRFDGVYRWHLGRAFPIRDEYGVIKEWFGTNTDIHDSKIASEELRILTQRLKDALHSRDEFISIASHELKTPMTSMKLKNQMYLRALNKGIYKVISPEKFRDLAMDTDKQITRITRLIDDMLDVSKIRLGKFTLDRTKFSLESLLREVAHRLAPQFHEAGIMLPEIRVIQNSIGLWDKDRIEQIFLNILTNTLKYAGKKQSLIILKKNSSVAQISFIDQGPGISQDTQNKIFERFERGISANEVSGLGLGLFISQQLALAHDGKITVESTEGEGATFTVELPLV